MTVAPPAGAVDVHRPGRDDTTPPVRRRRLLASLRALGYVSPIWVLVIAVGIVPTGYAVWMSLTEQTLTAAYPAFVGLVNYVQAVFTAQFAGALGVTLIFVLAGLITQFVVGYLLAVCLHQQLRGFKAIRTILLIPMLLTPAVVGLTWNFMFNPDLGVVQAIQGAFGVEANWMADPTLARLLVVMVDSWMNVPFVMLLVAAGMTSLPEEPIEAAAIDGAGWWKTTRYVVLPMLRPVLVITLLVRCVDIARIFDHIFTTTQGGPGTATQSVTLDAYNATFQFFQFGHGAAIALALALIMFPVYFLYVRLTKI
jgi:multiple sugar transport system permease protein